MNFDLNFKTNSCKWYNSIYTQEKVNKICDYYLHDYVIKESVKENKNSVPSEINGSKKIMIRGFPYYIYEGLMSHKTLFTQLPEDLQNKILENIAVPYINFIYIYKKLYFSVNYVILILKDNDVQDDRSEIYRQTHVPIMIWNRNQKSNKWNTRILNKYFKDNINYIHIELPNDLEPIKIKNEDVELSNNIFF